MKKRGQVDPVTISIGGLFLVGVLIAGAITSHNAIESSRYMFDPNTNTTYDLLKCASNQIPTGAYLLGGGLNEIQESKGHTEANC